MEFKEIIKSLRAEYNLTQNELADRINMSRSTVAKWEAGTVLPTVDNLLLLKKHFDISIDALLDTNDNGENKPCDVTKWRNSSIIKILLLGLSFALTFASILFDISGIMNAKGNYVKVPILTEVDLFRCLLLLIVITVWLHSILNKKRDDKFLCLTVFTFYACEIIQSIISFFFVNNIAMATTTQLIFRIIRWVVLPLACGTSIIIYYRKEDYINPGVVVLIYVTRLLEMIIESGSTIYHYRKNLLYFDSAFVNARIRWWNTVVIFTLFLYCALALTRERRLKNKMQKNNRGGGSIKA